MCVPRGDPLRADERSPARGRRDDDIGVPDGVPASFDRRKPDAGQRGGHLGGVTGGVFRVGAPDPHLPDVSDFNQGPDLIARLAARAHQAGPRAIPPGQVFCRHGTGRAGPHLRDVPVVEEHAAEPAGRGFEEKHQTVSDRKPEGGVPIKPRGDLDDIAFSAAEIGRLDVDFPSMGCDVQVDDPRHDRPAGAELGEGGFNGRDRLPEGDEAPDLRLAEDADVHPRRISRNSSSTLARPPRR